MVSFKKPKKRKKVRKKVKTKADDILPLGDDDIGKDHGSRSRYKDYYLTFLGACVYVFVICCCFYGGHRHSDKEEDAMEVDAPLPGEFCLGGWWELGECVLWVWWG